VPLFCLPNPKKRPYCEENVEEQPNRVESDDHQTKRLKSKSPLLPYTDWLYWRTPRMSCSEIVDE
jgi:hypothetical protein